MFLCNFYFIQIFIFHHHNILFSINLLHLMHSMLNLFIYYRISMNFILYKILAQNFSKKSVKCLLIIN